MKNVFLYNIIIFTFYPVILSARRDCLQQSELNGLQRIYSRPQRQDSTLSQQGYFYIHYDTTETNVNEAGPPELIDNNHNGVPDYIDEVGEIADSVRKVLVEIMGYQRTPYDADSIFDIYIMEYPNNKYGNNYLDENGTANQNQEVGKSSYLCIDNDFISHSEDIDIFPLDIMRISLAHEYFHAIQRGYRAYPGSNTYFYEMSAMWFEDIIVPEGNDYLDPGWINPLFDNPTLDFDNIGGGGYELALFGHYLSSFLDPKGLETAKSSTIVREIWERFSSSNSSAFSAVKFVLADNYNTSFIEAWVDFISRNIYNGIDETFYYYSDQAFIDPISTNPQYIFNTESFTIPLDDESVTLKSYLLNNVDTLFITHANNDYIGKIATISSGNIINKLFWSSNNASFITNDAVHFIYGSETQNLLLVKIFNFYPYNYSLKDINLNSETYSVTLNPSYFENQVLLHYFDHQNNERSILNVNKLDSLYKNLQNEGIENVKIIAVGKEQYAEYNDNWIYNKVIPILNDSTPDNNTWENWSANQQDLFFHNIAGQYVLNINVVSLEYETVYNMIMEMIKGCADQTSCNYNANASFNYGCYYAEANYDCNGNCVLNVDCFGMCGGSAILDLCGNCDGQVTDLSECVEFGCMDMDACNYNENVTISDESCVMPPLNYNCLGECISVIDCNGVCGGESIPDIECLNGEMVCTPVECHNLSSANEFISGEFVINGAYPNPFNPVANINYTLPHHIYLICKVFDIKGNQIEILIDDFQSAGKHTISWNASNYPSGIYFVVMLSSSFKETKKLVLIK